MTFEQYWTLLIKRWHIILICFLVVGLGAFIGSKLLKPLYQSSSLVQVVIRTSSNNQADINNLMASDQLVQTEATLAVGDPVLREVASHYPGLTVTQLAGEVSSTARTSTQLFEIDVVDPSPTRAAILANDIAMTLIKQQLQSIQQDNAQAQKQIQQNLDLTSQQIDDTTAKISALQTKGGNQGQIALLQAQLSGFQQRYNQWQAALAQLELTQAQAGDPLKVAQPAQPAISPIRPNIPLYTAVGLLVGLLLGMLLALLYERLDTRVRTAEEITQLSEWPVLATIWRAKSSSPEDLINPTGHNVNVEAFRILRTNIGFSSMDKTIRSIVVTSAIISEGKSTVAANLAISMAMAGRPTLLIDADLRGTTLHTLFNLSSDGLGLSNAILAFSKPGAPNTSSGPQYQTFASIPPMLGVSATASRLLEPFVHAVGIPNLWIMPSGPLPPNPSEFLESKVMQHFLAAIADCGVEIVIFDTPPLLGLSDTSILTSKVDGALVVIDTTRSTKAMLRKLKAVLSQPSVHVLGCVANKLHRKRDDNTNYYYRTMDQKSEEQYTGNGHKPSTPIPQTSVGLPFGRKFPSN